MPMEIDPQTAATLGTMQPAGTAPAPVPPALQPPTTAPGPLAPAPAPVAPPPQAVAKVSRARRATELLGHATRGVLSALYGPATETQIDPETGKESQVEVKQSGSQLFRHILAGALLGGAAAEQAHARNHFMGLAGGLAVGGGTAIEKGVEDSELQRQHAREEFQREQVAKTQKLEEMKEAREDDISKAQKALMLAQTFNLAVQTQGTSFEFHKAVADMNRAAWEPLAAVEGWYKTPDGTVIDNIPESKAHEALVKYGLAGTVVPAITGVHTTFDKAGNPHYEYLVSAVDPKGKTKLTGEAIQSLKDKKYGQVHPGIFESYLTPGRELSVQEYAGIVSQADAHYLEFLKQQKEVGALEEVHQRTEAAKAEKARYQAETLKTQLELTMGKSELSEKKLGAKARLDWDRLTKAHDGDSLEGLKALAAESPSEAQLVANGFEPAMKTLREEFLSLQKNDSGQPVDADRAAELQQHIHDLEEARNVTTPRGKELQKPRTVLPPNSQQNVTDAVAAVKKFPSSQWKEKINDPKFKAALTEYEYQGVLRRLFPDEYDPAITEHAEPVRPVAPPVGIAPTPTGR